LATKQQLAQELQDAMRRNAMWTVMLHSATAAKVGINVTDAQCINLLTMDGPMTPGHLAEAVGITTGGAITAVIDRLEEAGLVHRRPDPADRRRVIIEAVPERIEHMRACFAPIVESSRAIFSKYSEDELEFLIGFAADVRAMMPTVIKEIRALP
jgi:DNA-binding MarR family transcriptional regulator